MKINDRSSLKINLPSYELLAPLCSCLRRAARQALTERGESVVAVVDRPERGQVLRAHGVQKVLSPHTFEGDETVVLRHVGHHLLPMTREVLVQQPRREHRLHMVRNAGYTG